MKRVRNNVFRWILSCFLAVLLSMEIFAAETAAGTELMAGGISKSPEETYKTESEGTDSDLYEAYVNQVFYGETVSVYGRKAGDRLTGDEKLLYDALVPHVRRIADGERTSAKITVGKSLEEYYGPEYAVDTEVAFSGSVFSTDMIGRVVDALLADLPYECYWYDKTSGCIYSNICGPELLQLSIRFTVADNYRGGDEYTADSGKTGAAKAAAASAAEIVDKYASASDYEKLTGYKTEICTLVSYNFDAADHMEFSQNSDPWQMIFVFDGDDSTNVVCEGYSKAFKYLCDITSFEGDVSCYLVLGCMNGGSHMWNIVTISGQNYLTDITNSDDSAIGADGSLFLAGANGTPDEGYVVGPVVYVYANDVKDLWGTGPDSILVLSEQSYQEEEESEIVIPAAPEVTAANVASSGKIRLTWKQVDGAETYQVYRSTSGKTGTFKRIYTTSGTKMTNTSTEPGKRYYYKIRAVDANGTVSEFSKTVSRLCDLAQPTVKISNVSSSGKPILTWNPVDGAKAYEVYRSVSGKDGTFKKTYTTSAVSYTNTGAKAGTQYYYKVRAVHENSNANSAFSEVKTRVCDVKRPVISVKLNASGKPKVTWGAVDGAVKYEVYRAVGKNGTYKKIFTTSKTSMTNTSASAGTTYYYKVKAIHSKSSANSSFSTVKYIRSK